MDTTTRPPPGGGADMAENDMPMETELLVEELAARAAAPPSTPAPKPRLPLLVFGISRLAPHKDRASAPLPPGGNPAPTKGPRR